MTPQHDAILRRLDEIEATPIEDRVQVAGISDIIERVTLDFEFDRRATGSSYPDVTIARARAFALGEPDKLIAMILDENEDIVAIAKPMDWPFEES